MCSVVGLISASGVRQGVLASLKRLEYRGYDSAGYAEINANSVSIEVKRAEGFLDNLAQQLQLNTEPHTDFIGIGHTRWATHGKVTVNNAHPHISCDGKIAVVHNGIIENYVELKSVLESQGHFFRSETDTEVIVHQFEEFLFQGKTPEQALGLLAFVLKGTYAIVLLAYEWPDSLFFIRKGSPLCVGFSHADTYIASDVLAFTGKVTEGIFIPDESYGILYHDNIHLWNFNHTSFSTARIPMSDSWIVSDKGDYEHYMLKEMYEQKDAIKQTIMHYQWYEDSLHELLGLESHILDTIEKIILVGCGTSWHAGRIGEFFFESIAGVPASAVLASEYRYKTFFPSLRTLYVFVSQSGETADTLEVLRMINAYNLVTVALTNVSTSTLVRECHGVLLTHAGPEIAVASTKAFSTQVSALYWLALTLSYNRKLLSYDEYRLKQHELFEVADILEETMTRYKDDIMYHEAPYYKETKHAIFIGRHVSYTFALEAALKLKEISYIFSQAYPAGELKHGPLALIDSQTPVFVFSHPDPILYQKTLSNAQEVYARNGRLIVFACEGQTELIKLAEYSFVVPRVSSLLFPLAITGVMQYFCYALAKACDRPIDKPRNLAKSVTVE